MMSNLVASLILAERIQTTDAKAKELKRLADRTISWGTRLGDLLTRPKESLSEEERAKIVHHMRMARRVCKHPEALRKLFHEVAPRFLGRPGGYTRVLKVGQRQGDAAPVSLVELVVLGAAAKSEANEKGGKGGKEKSGGQAEKSAS